MPSDTISTTWERFIKCLRSVPDHKIVDDPLVEIFNQALDDNCKEVADTITRGSFLDCTVPIVAERLEKIEKTKHAWGKRDKSTTKSSFVVSTDPE